MKLDEVDTDNELQQAVARKLLSFILAEGEVFLSSHARQAMKDDDMSEQDVFNVLRAGRIYEPAEFERDSWRYRCHTERYCAVVAFDSASKTVVVTTWRKK